MDSESKLNLPILALKCLESTTEKNTFLYDTGAEISIINVFKLKTDTKVILKNIEIKGIGGIGKTIGFCYLTIKCNNKYIKHKFYILPNEFPISTDGIIGFDFINTNNLVMDYKQKTVSILNENLNDNNNIKIIELNKNFGENEFENLKMENNQKNNEYLLKARHINLIEIKVNSNEEGIINKINLPENLFMANMLVSPIEFKTFISIINISEKDITIKLPNFNIETFIEPIEQNEQIDEKNIFHFKAIDRNSIIKENLRLDHLNIEEQESILEICENFGDIFFIDGDKLSRKSNHKHKIILNEKTNPLHIKQYKIPFTHRNDVEKEVDKLLKNEIIEESSSPWNAPILLVPKKLDASNEKKMRLVIDYRKLNNITKSDTYPLPLIDEILNQLGKCKYFTLLDLYSGFYQMELEEASQEYTAFTANGRKFQFKKMPMGLKNSPASFQRMMNSALSGLTGVSCLLYLDDIIVFGSTLSEHNENLIKTFNNLRKNDLKLQPNKCEFAKQECYFLGHKITENGIFPDPRKMEVVKNYPIPKNQKDIKCFLGLMGYYRKFIKNFAHISNPLTKLLKKDIQFSWGYEEQTSFESLINKLLSPNILIYPDFDKEFILTTDASGVGVGAVLSQEIDNIEKPIAFASRTLNSAERNYSTIEKELLAVIWGTKQFRQYLYGKSFTIITDHKPLVYLYNFNNPSSRLMRWRLLMEEYDYKVIYKKGSLNCNADSLSRMYNVSNININNVSESEKLDILKEFHSSLAAGHKSCEATYKKIINNGISWEHMHKDVEDFVKKCESCQKNKLYRKSKLPMVITDTPTKPMEKCSLDIVGPLPKTANGHLYLLTFQDLFTKFSIAIPLRAIDSETIARKFVKYIILKYGLMETILTDQGSNFLSLLFKNICKIFKIKKIQTSAYHPESNGCIERFHRTLKEYLRHFINNNQDNWNELVSFGCFSYNTTIHESTGFTPHFLHFGRDAQVPSSLHAENKSFYEYNDFVSEVQHNIRASFEIARNHIIKSKEKNKIIYDRKTKDTKFKVGNKVKLLVESVRQGRSKKLEPQWSGPYTIIESLNDVNFKIKMGRKEYVVHGNRLKEYYD